MNRTRLCVVAACVWIAASSWGASNAWACSCVDWDSMGAAEARKSFLAEWARAEVVVSAMTTAVTDRETRLKVGRVYKGTAPELLRLFPRPAEARPRQQDGAWVSEFVMDCRPFLASDTEYLVLLFRQPDGTLDGERCSVWAGEARRKREAWVPRRGQ